MKLEKISYKGWDNCLQLSNEFATLVVTLDVGPRIISYALKGGKNVFKNYEEMMGVTEGAEWMIFGGHRLWHAPEDALRTYAPDFGPVAHEWDGVTLTLRPPEESGTGIRKELDVSLEPNSAGVRVVHRLYNHNLWDVTLAPWALSVMDAGARAIVPQEPFGPHPDFLLPARPLVLWRFTDMSDPRWHWGRKYIQLQQDPGKPMPQKLGLFNHHGWAACAVNACLFVKKYPALSDAPHADMGANTEIFTNGDMLELETLGPLARIPSGGQVAHVEHWGLFPVKVDEREENIEQSVLPCVDKVSNV